MEFKFRSVDYDNNKNQPPPLFSSHQELMMSMTQRDANRIERERIREEMIAAEVERRRSKLEEEVRREFMMMEALKADGGVGGFGSGSPWLVPVNEGMMRPFNPRMACCFHSQFDDRLMKDRLAFSGGCGGSGGFFNHCSMMPQTMLPQSPLTMPAFGFGSGNKKVIMLAKPETTTCGVKRKAVEPPADEPPVEEVNNEFSFAGIKKKPKEEWICDVCQISVSSRGQLDEHLGGKKHKVKEARSRAGKTGKTERTASSSELNLDDASSGLKEQVEPEIHQVLIDGLGKISGSHDVAEKTASSIGVNLGNAGSGVKEQAEGESHNDLIDGSGDKANNKEVAERTAIATNLVDVDVDVSLGLKEEVIGAKLQNLNGVTKMNDDKEEECKSNEMLCSESEDAKNLNEIEATRMETVEHAASSEAVMEGHLKGKKHLTLLKGLAENSGTNKTFMAIPLPHGNEKVRESVSDESVKCVAATTAASNTVVDDFEEGEFRVQMDAPVNVAEAKAKADDANDGMADKKNEVSVISNTVAATVMSPESTPAKKFKSWCDMCHLGSDSEGWMERHLKGRIHVCRLLDLTAKPLTRACEKVEESTTAKVAENSFEGKDEARLTMAPDTTDNTASQMKTKIETKTCQVLTDGLINATPKIDGRENKNELGAESLNIGEQTMATTAAFTAKSNYKFWCEVCQIGTKSEAPMQDHLKGKKHLTRLRRKQTQNGTA